MTNVRILNLAHVGESRDKPGLEVHCAESVVKDKGPPPRADTLVGDPASAVVVKTGNYGASPHTSKFRYAGVRVRCIATATL